MTTVEDVLYTRKELEILYRHCHQCIHREYDASHHNHHQQQMSPEVAAVLRKAKEFVGRLVHQNNCWRITQFVDQVILECCKCSTIQQSVHAEKQYGCMFTGVRDDTLQLQFVHVDAANPAAVSRSMIYVVHQSILPKLDALHILCNVHQLMDICASRAQNRVTCEPSAEPELEQLHKVFNLSAVRLWGFAEEMRERSEVIKSAYAALCQPHAAPAGPPAVSSSSQSQSSSCRGSDPSRTVQ